MTTAPTDTLSRLDAVQTGRMRARDWLEDSLARIDATDGRVNAFTPVSYTHLTLPTIYSV